MNHLIWFEMTPFLSKQPTFFFLCKLFLHFLIQYVSTEYPILTFLNKYTILLWIGHGWLMNVMFVCTSADPNTESLPRERARERDRGRSHERKHHSSSAAERQQRYYSCDRYGSHELGHSVSAGPSRSTSPGEPHDPNRLKQVRWFLSVTLASTSAVLTGAHSFASLCCVSGN